MEEGKLEKYRQPAPLDLLEVNLRMSVCFLHTNSKAICSLCSTIPCWISTRMQFTNTVLPACLQWSLDEPQKHVFSPHHIFVFCGLQGMFALVNQTGKELSPRVDSDLWMGLNCPWEMPTFPDDGRRTGEPTLNLEALDKCQQDHSACLSRANCGFFSVFRHHRSNPFLTKTSEGCSWISS